MVVLSPMPFLNNDETKLDPHTENIANEEKQSIQEETPVFQIAQDETERAVNNLTQSAT